MRSLAPLLLLAATSACSASLLVEVSAPEGHSLDGLRLLASMYAPGKASGVDCAGIVYGDFDDNDLLASLVGSAELSDAGGPIGQVPRTGSKLVVIRAVDAHDRLQLAGCKALGEIKKTNQVLRLDLEPATELSDLRLGADVPDLAVADSLFAEIRRGQEAKAAPSLSVGLRDATGQAMPAGVELRMQLVWANGSKAPATLHAVDDSGRVELHATIDRSGPFVVELSPRFAPDPPGRVYIRGFAAPADREPQVFTPNNVIWSAAAPLGSSGAGFVALVVESGQRHLDLAQARREDGAWVFEHQRGPDGDFLPAGRVFDNRSGIEQSAVVVQPAVGALLQRRRPQVQVVYASERPPLTLAWTGDRPQDAMSALAIPVGPCDSAAYPGAHVDAPPLLLSLTRRGASGELSHVELRLADLDGSVGPDFTSCLGGDEQLSVQQSYCVDDTSGRPHRLLLVRGERRGTDGALRRRSRVVDLDAGLSAELLDQPQAICARLLGAPVEELDRAQMLGPALAVDGGDRLVRSLFAGLSTPLELLRVRDFADADERVLYGDQLLSRNLPLPAELLAAAPMTGAQGVDVVAVLSEGLFDPESSSSFLGVLSEAPGYDQGPIFGGFALGSCPQSGRKVCTLLLADINGDGRREILLSRPGDVGEATFLILTLGG